MMDTTAVNFADKVFEVCNILTFVLFIFAVYMIYERRKLEKEFRETLAGAIKVETELINVLRGIDSKSSEHRKELKDAEKNIITHIREMETRLTRGA